MWFIGLAMLCLAQGSQPAAKVWGSVFDPNEALIPRVSVTLKNHSTQEILQTTTNEEGRFIFDAVSSGSYELTAETPYFQKLSKTISIKDQTETQFDLTLDFRQCPDTIKRLTEEEKRAVTVCGLHHEQLKVGVVPIEYGLIILADDDPGRLFPNSKMIYYGGCVADCYEKAEVVFCPFCRRLESKLRKERNSRDR